MPPVRTVKPDGSKIRRLRKQRGLTVLRLAAKIGRHPQTVTNIEGQSREASEVLISQIAQALGVDPTEIVCEDEPQPNGSAAA